MSDKHKDQEQQEDTVEGLDFPSRKELEDKLTAMEQQVEECRNQVLRAQAEMENVRRRAKSDIANAREFGSQSLVKDLLPIMDSMIRGLESPDSQDPHAKAMREGLAITLDMLQKMMLKHGVEFIDPKRGDVFNPEKHEAMSMVSDPNAEPNTISEVLQKGYLLNGRVLRAAMVIVAS